VRILRPLLGIAIVVAAALALAPAAPAAVGPVAYAGVHARNNIVCGRTWAATDLGRGDYVNTYNAPGTCIRVSGWHDLAWSVVRTAPEAGWQMPNVSWGTEWTRYTCDDAPSAYGPGSACERFPVQEDRDGTPLATATWWRAPSRGDVAWDIWFNRTYVAPADTRQDDGTEVMIWLDDSHIGIRPSWYWRYDGVTWAVETWIAGPRDGVTWRYVAYVATRPAGRLGIWVNHVFRDAIAHGVLSPHSWLTSINFGPEIAPYATGTGFAARASLTGVK
jgi:hypothetical protein